jgi:hypothetical protein
LIASTEAVPLRATSARPKLRPIGWDGVSTGAAIVVGAVAGLALGILVSVTTEVPLAPEVGLLLGVLAGWLSRRGTV